MEKPDRPADPPRPHQRTTLRTDARNHQKSRSVDQGSGRRWNFDAILGLLTQEADVADNVGIDIIGLEARVLTGDVIQVFWDSERDGRRARRTSLWQRTPEAWQQTYHQGTLLP